ncbi:hypothetical protein [Streptomyces sp. NPDC051662]|uniref:hypothetical protein n=1 Tax=Streptomyces sp. NPDC051662 TaxID=3154750 RepID=UPI00343B79DA
MKSLFQRLDEEEAIVRRELSALREKIAVAEERLVRLAITRETAASLLGDSGVTEDSGTEPEEPEQAPGSENSPHEPGTSSGSADGTSSDKPDPSAGRLGWAEARESWPRTTTAGRREPVWS